MSRLLCCKFVSLIEANSNSNSNPNSNSDSNSNSNSNSNSDSDPDSDPDSNPINQWTYLISSKDISYFMVRHISLRWLPTIPENVSF